MGCSIVISSKQKKILPSHEVNPLYRNLLKKGSHPYFANYGDGILLFQKIPDGDFSLWHSSHLVSETSKLSYVNHRPLLTLHVALNGEYQWQLEKNGIIPMKLDEVNLIYLPCSKFSLQLQKDLPIKTFDILLPPFYLNQFKISFPFLKKFIDKINADEEAVLSRTNIHGSKKILCRVEQLINCRFEKSLRRLYFEARIMDIILEFLDLMFATNYRSFQLTKEEEGRILKIKELLQQNSHLHFTIRELARKAMVNELKFKKGFKLLTGATVFDFHFNVRMRKAKDLLRAGDFALDFIAEQAGYEHVSSFIAAFKQLNGCTPAAFRKQLS